MSAKVQPEDMMARLLSYGYVPLHNPLYDDIDLFSYPVEVRKDMISQADGSAELIVREHQQVPTLSVPFSYTWPLFLGDYLNQSKDPGYTELNLDEAAEMLDLFVEQVLASGGRINRTAATAFAYTHMSAKTVLVDMAEAVQIAELENISTPVLLTLLRYDVDIMQLKELNYGQITYSQICELYQIALKNTANF
jgi:hypothetical protein